MCRSGFVVERLGVLSNGRGPGLWAASFVGIVSIALLAQAHLVGAAEKATATKPAETLTILSKTNEIKTASGATVKTVGTECRINCSAEVEPDKFTKYAELTDEAAVSYRVKGGAVAAGDLKFAAKFRVKLYNGDFKVTTDYEQDRPSGPSFLKSLGFNVDLKDYYTQVKAGTVVPLQNRAGWTFPLTVIVESGASLDKLTKFVGQSNADWTNLFSAVDVYLQNGQKVKLDDEKITKALDAVDSALKSLLDVGWGACFTTVYTVEVSKDGTVTIVERDAYKATYHQLQLNGVDMEPLLKWKNDNAAAKTYSSDQGWQTQ